MSSAAAALEMPRAADSDEDSILGQLLSSRKPGLALLLADRQGVADKAAALAREYNCHQNPQHVLKRLRRLHLMDALIAHVGAIWRQDADTAIKIVRSLYAIFGLSEVQARMRAVCLHEVINLVHGS